jgi:hypothetical protein
VGEWRMDLVALLGAAASAIALLMTTLRKRQDVDVSELKTRTTDLSSRLTEAEKEVGTLRAALLHAEERIFKLLRLLAKHGIREVE